MDFAIVIPVYAGEQTIQPLVERLLSELTSNLREIILVWDYGPDQSLAICKKLVSLYPGTVRLIELSRNFGEHAAVLCGLNHVKADGAVIMDEDFQNPPSEVKHLLEELEKGFDVVYGNYEKKEHHVLRNLGSRFNGWVASILLKKPRNLYLSSFKAISRFAIDEVTKYDLPYPYIDGLLLRVTRNISSVTVQHNARTEGQSGYTLRKLISLWLNMFTNFSILPLRTAMLLGLAMTSFGFILMLFVLYWSLIENSSPKGWPTLMICLVLFSGTQMIAMGMIGEYLGRLFLSHNGTPQFIVRHHHEEPDPS